MRRSDVGLGREANVRLMSSYESARWMVEIETESAEKPGVVGADRSDHRLRILPYRDNDLSRPTPPRRDA